MTANDEKESRFEE
jgi:hypothetical protein